MIFFSDEAQGYLRMKGKLFCHPTEAGLCRSEYQQRTAVNFFSCQELHYTWAVNEWILVLNTLFPFTEN